MSVSIPKNVVEFMAKPATVKALVSVCDCGKPHAIVCGSIIVVDEKTMAVGEVLMKKTTANMKQNDNVALLGVNGLESYLVKAKVGTRITSGPLFDGMNAELAKVKLKASAVWTFDVQEVFDESAGPNAGKKLA